MVINYKKALLYGFLFAWTLVQSHAQTITPLPKINKEFLVVIHVVLDPTGALGVDTNQIKSDFNIVNGAFKPIETSFRICEIRLIKNFQYNDTLKDVYMPEMHSKYNLEKRINVFYIEDFFPIGTVCGKASLGGITSTSNIGVFIKKFGCGAGTIIHELGHFFSLPHTFADGNGNELVNKSNCSTSADQVCDTPADPYVHPGDVWDYVTTDCVYYYGTKDSNGQYYQPDISNPMSYYIPCRCNKFSHGQYEKMANYYLSNPNKW